MGIQLSRRDFLRRTSLASASLFIPQFMRASGTLSFGDAGKPKILVVIQLSGGNDGLNTVIPFRNDIYYEKRPVIGIKAPDLIRISDDTGLNPSLQGLADLYLNGEAVIINNVGYPNPNRSHFRSMDIWQSASDESKYLSSGWLGRILDATCQDQCVSPHYAVEMDDSLSLAMKGDHISGFAVRDPKSLRKTGANPFIDGVAGMTDLEENLEHPQVAYLHKVLSDTYESTGYLQEQSKVFSSTAVYPGTDLGRQLKAIAELIISGSETRIYYVSHSGFDTHAGQRGQQDRQLKIYSDALKVFTDDLKSNGRFDETMVLTFSEFGRRVEQNASNGTDHGTANNVFVMSGGLKRAGIVNDLPDLSNLDEGDLRFQTDFRSIYATIIDRWLHADSGKILQGNFGAIDFI